MRRRLLPSGLLLLAGLGCATPSPGVVLHTLSPLAPEASAPPLKDLRVEILPLRLPEVLQRAQLVLQTGAERMELAEGHRWASGLDQEFLAILRENLTRLLGSDGIVAYPDGARAKATFRISLEIHRCEARPGKGLQLKATWMILPAQGGPALRLQRTELEEAVRSTDLDALVAAHSRAMAALSRQIAEGLRACVS